MNSVLQNIQQAALIVFLLASMLALGASIGIREVIAPLRDKRLVALALLLNFVLSPGFAWMITAILPLESGHAAGLLLLGGAAGAPFLPKLAEISRATPAAAAALMILLTAGTLLFLPFVMPWLIPGLSAHPWAIARPLVLMILSPLMAGLVIKACAPALAGRLAPVLAGTGTACLVVLFVLLVALNIPALIGVLGSGAIAAVALYTTGLFTLCWLIVGSRSEFRGILALGTSARNFGAALVPAVSSFQDPKVVVMLIVSAIVSLILAFLEARWVAKRRLPA